MATVAKVGVRKRGLMRARRSGSARYAAIESTARAVGMMVVCVEAVAEVVQDDPVPSLRVAALIPEKATALRSAIAR